MSVPATAIAVLLAFHPFSTPSSGFAHRALAPEAPAEPGEAPQPGWDEEEAVDEPPSPAVTPETAPPPSSVPTVAAPPPSANAKPRYGKGTGLIIGASITGGLGWIAALTRLAFVKQCEKAVRDADSVDTGVSAGMICFVRAGAGNVALIPLQYTLGATTWGLAAGAGAVRGRYDGVEDAWSGKPGRKTAGFIGAGASVLALGIIGRITAAVLVGRPYRHLRVDEDGNVAAGKFAAEYRARLVGVQLSSATIALGAGLLAYGIAYRKHNDEQRKVVQQVRITPDFGVDSASGLSYGGIALTGRF